MFKQLSLALLLALTLTVNACSKADRKFPVTTKPSPSPVPTTEMDSPANMGGFLKDKTGKSVANASVTIRYIGKDGINTDMVAVKSTPDGTFFVENIPVKFGEYVSIVITADGYESQTVEKYLLGTSPPVIRLDKIKAKK